MAEFTSPYSDGDIDTNRTNNRSLQSIVDERYSRRQTIRGALTASTTAFLGTALLAACDDDDDAARNTSLVDAGAAITTNSGRAVVISGSLQGPGGSVQWTQTGGPAVSLTGATTATPSFIAPSVPANTSLTFTATATSANGNQSIDTVTVTVRPNELGFAPVPKTLADMVTVPAGYSVTVVTRLGDPIAPGVAAYRNDGTDADFAQRVGDHGDAFNWYGLSEAGAREELANIRGLMVQNHENLNVQYLHPNGPTNVSTGPRPAAEALKEIEAHGVSVIEYRDAGNRNWSYVQNSTFNRRITPNTPMDFRGPVRGSEWLRTVAAASGTTGTGTINNCANGRTMWGTNLTCEENWAGYFRRPAALDTARTARELTSLRRYGVSSTNGNYAWWTAGTEPMFARWNAVATGASALEDYRNEPYKFGWVVELDPYDPNSTPRKRTALGRMGHEGAWLGRIVPGQRVAIYMGDDSRREYLYKYVSDAAWSASDAQASDRLGVGDKYLDEGTLYVARFNPDGTGTWLPLVFGQVPDRPAVLNAAGAVVDPVYVFADQADVLVNTRLAADALGATPMDRPEWTATNNLTGEIYLTLTNNNEAGRPLTGTDTANPRHYNDPKGSTSPVPDPATPAQPTNQFGNPNGHILRLRESNDNGASSTFRWDIYLFGADAAEATADVNLSGLRAENDFSSPDGLWFARPTNASGLVRPLLWIQTDDGALTDRTNNQMLAALPGTTGDGGARTITNTGRNGATAQQATFVGAPATPASLRRFLVGPRECEITGVDTTPDGRTLFVGIQHPGEDGTPDAPSSNWPQSQSGTPSGRPRSAIVAITKDDGGVVGL
jgi:secreted PhoX family phosphatase